MDSRRLDWKLAHVIDSNMVEICDVTMIEMTLASPTFRARYGTAVYI